MRPQRPGRKFGARGRAEEGKGRGEKMQVRVILERRLPERRIPARDLTRGLVCLTRNSRKDPHPPRKTAAASP